ncbi:MAG TPA: hypothetical protein VI076_01980 [Actinopolymorphaceae bacterium]
MSHTRALFGPHPITVAELRKAIEQYDDNTVVVLARDAEGNGYAPLSGLMPGSYGPNSRWTGDASGRGHACLVLCPR